MLTAISVAPTVPTVCMALDVETFYDLVFDGHGNMDACVVELRRRRPLGCWWWLRICRWCWSGRSITTFS
ncbi:Hypothetical protein, putative [Bodo saltans]|uniref:Uncharacterized protein n=1 Tax=Bodo saltans TaxID=75058 RepID=A0A0S4JHQ5_BODSA|nr:Hypothetical protein, putative [Bodo saltans]|eukprot:CUG91013.1 Hypothetical protein, putative [Bodo saltans]